MVFFSFPCVKVGGILDTEKTTSILRYIVISDLVCVLSSSLTGQAQRQREDFAVGYCASIGGSVGYSSDWCVEDYG